MNKERARGLLCLSVASVLACAPAAFAQNGSEDLIEEIMVTATKRVQSIYEVPVAVSAFQGDKLAQQGIVDIVDIGKFVPNLNITQFSAGHVSSSNPFIRGIGLQDHLITTDPGVSVYEATIAPAACKPPTKLENAGGNSSPFSQRAKSGAAKARRK